MELQSTEKGHKVAVRFDTEEEHFIATGSFPKFSRRGLASMAEFWYLMRGPEEFPHTMDFTVDEIFTLAGGLYKRCIELNGSGMYEEFNDAYNQVSDFLQTLDTTPYPQQ